jgi:hypothetical protein
VLAPCLLGGQTLAARRLVKNELIGLDHISLPKWAQLSSAVNPRLAASMLLDRSSIELSNDPSVAAPASLLALAESR